MPEGKGADGKVKLGHGGLSARCEGIGGEGGQGKGVVPARLVVGKV